MNIERSTKWVTWRNHIQTRCYALTQRFSEPGTPVALKSIAESCGVSRVEFRPLLIDGGLAIADRKFVVYVNCEKSRAEELSKQFSQDGGRTLPKRARFTIAHELIHTFFFDQSGVAPKSKLKAVHHKVHDSLEQACDYGANLLLVPPRQLMRNLGRISELSPRVIIDLATEFNVSLQTLLISLKGLDYCGSHKFFAALVSTKNNSLVVQTTAADLVTKHMFSAVKPNEPIERYIKVDNLELFGGTERRAAYAHPCRVGMSSAAQSCAAMCEPTTKTLDTFILLIRPEGQVRVVG